MRILRRPPAVQVSNGESVREYVLEEKRAVTVTALVTSSTTVKPAAAATTATQHAIGVIPIIRSDAVKSPTSTSTFFITVTPPAIKSTNAVEATTTTTSSSSSSTTSSSTSAISTLSSTTQTTSSTSTTSTSVTSTSSTLESVPSASAVAKGATEASAAQAAATSSTDMTTGTVGAVHRSSIPSGAVAAIVVVVILIVLCLGFLLVRKYYTRKRQMRRRTWGAGIVNIPDFAATEKNYEEARLANKAPSIRGMDREEYLPNPYPVAPATYAAAASLAAPAMSYNNPMPPVAPSVRVPVGAAAAAASNAALVQCTFIPSLPDELSISTGETVRIVGEYDDGWALCVNGRGDQGMVPLECLDRSFGRMGPPPPANLAATGDWRASKRVSSLTIARFARMT